MIVVCLMALHVMIRQGRLLIGPNGRVCGKETGGMDKQPRGGWRHCWGWDGGGGGAIIDQ